MSLRDSYDFRRSTVPLAKSPPTASLDSMSAPDSDAGSSALSARQAVFATTHWSVVLSAQDEDSSHAAEALQRLCKVYWYPL